MKVVKKIVQPVVILFLLGVIIYSYNSNKSKINKDVLYASIYVDEELNESSQALHDLNKASFEAFIKNDSISNSMKQTLIDLHKLTDSICDQIIELKHVAIDISGGMQDKENLYTINNLGYNFGHKNELTGDKGENNGLGSKLKLQIERLRELGLQLISDSNDKMCVEKMLNTAGKKEQNSDYIFSWEEQYFKLLPTVGIINLLSVIENNVLISESIVLNNISRNNK